MAKKKGKKGTKGKKGKSKTKKKQKSGRKEELAVREPEAWHPSDIMRSLDNEFDRFRRDIERALWTPLPWRRPLAMRWGEPEWSQAIQPPMDIRDTGKEYIVEAELPGITKDDIDIELTRNSLKIQGQTRREEEREEEGFFRRERSYSSFHRNVPLPEDIKPDKADATFNNGILEIKLPKQKPTEREKAHKVKVK